VIEKQQLRFGRGVASHCTLNHIRGDLLSTVVSKVLADEFGYLYVYVSVVVLQDLLDYVVAILIIDQCIQLSETHVDKGSLYD